jgi:hypothetical protein
MPTTKPKATKPKATKSKAHKGGAAGDAYPGDHIAGPVVNTQATPFNSDAGIPSLLPYHMTAAQLSAVNVYEGGKAKKATAAKPKTKKPKTKK